VGGWFSSGLSSSPSVAGGWFSSGLCSSPSVAGGC